MGDCPVVIELGVRKIREKADEKKRDRSRSQSEKFNKINVPIEKKVRTMATSLVVLTPVS
jgi:plastocyanin domain-containing protein